MTITVVGNNAFADPDLNNIEIFISTALVGANLNSQGFYQTHQADPNFGFLTQSITLDDPATGSTNNYLSFTNSAGPLIQHGIIANTVNDGGTSDRDTYYIEGLRIAGTSTTLTKFTMGGRIYDADNFGSELAPISGPAGDNYFVQTLGGLKFEVQHAGFGFRC